MATVRIDYFGMEGEGRNVTEAKRKAGAKLQAAMSGHYSPTVIAYRGYVSLVFREPHGWCNRLIAEPESGIREGKVYAHPNETTEAEAIRAACRHLADLGMRDDDTEPPYFLKDRQDIADWRSNHQFRARFRRAMRAGLDKDQAHNFAGRNPAIDSATMVAWESLVSSVA